MARGAWRWQEGAEVYRFETVGGRVLASVRGRAGALDVSAFDGQVSVTLRGAAPREARRFLADGYPSIPTLPAFEEVLYV
jgi:hypothetical protein